MAANVFARGPGRNGRSAALALTIVLGTAALAAPAALAQVAGRKIGELDEVGVTEKLGDQAPVDLSFVDSDGGKVTLGDYFDGTRPVLLTMNYSNCPMLCSLQLNGLVSGLERMKWDLGENFQVVTVSIDPTETPGRAADTKAKYLKIYGRSGVADGWHFLTGRDENIHKLADAVGFRYQYLEDTGQYAHAAVTMVMTPDGRVSRYLYGIEYDPQTIRLSLTEAADGNVGSTVDQILLFCFHYDAEKGRYGPAAYNVMRAGGVVTILVLGGLVLVFWRRGTKRAKVADDRPAPDETSEGERTE